MKALDSFGLNIKYEVKYLIRTMDFSNILFDESVAELYDKHAVYTIKNLLLTITFAQNPKATASKHGDFSLQFHTDEEIYEHFEKFLKNGSLSTVNIDPHTFSNKTTRSN
jgi:hypothetical protein